jgi:uncharacterized membrane protein
MMNNVKPSLIIKKEIIDYFLEFGALIVLMATWGYTIYNFNKLPDIIATHFDISGKPNGFGSKLTIWLLPVIISFIYILIYVLNRNPQKFNYLTTITDQNAYKQYKLASRSLRIILFNITFLFAFITFKEIDGAYTKSSALEWWFIPLLLCSTIIPTFYMIIVSGSKKYN